LAVDFRPEAKRAVEKLLDSYCDHIDRRDLTALAEVFTPECRVRYGDAAIEGLSALLGYLRTGLVRFETTQHIVSNVEIEEESPRHIRSIARVRAFHRFVDARPDLTIFGQYRSLLQATQAGWRIAEHYGSELGRESPSHPLGEPTGGDS